MIEMDCRRAIVKVGDRSVQATEILGADRVVDPHAVARTEHRECGGGANRAHKMLTRVNRFGERRQVIVEFAISNRVKQGSIPVRCVVRKRRSECSSPDRAGWLMAATRALAHDCDHPAPGGPIRYLRGRTVFETVRGERLRGGAVVRLQSLDGGPGQRAALDRTFRARAP
jgi:hypothetical protein